MKLILPQYRATFKVILSALLCTHVLHIACSLAAVRSIRYVQLTIHLRVSMTIFQEQKAVTPSYKNKEKR